MRKLLKLQSSAYSIIKYNIGNGERISFWFDNWHPLSSLNILLSNNDVNGTDLLLHDGVAWLINEDGWNQRPCISILMQSIKQQALAIQPSLTRQNWITPLPNPKGTYTTGSAWDYLKPKGDQVPCHKLLWSQQLICIHLMTGHKK